MYRECVLFSLVAVVGCGAASGLTVGARQWKPTVDGKPQRQTCPLNFILYNSAGTKGPMSIGMTDGEGKFSNSTPAEVRKVLSLVNMSLL